jgi:hypothetical protein
MTMRRAICVLATMVVLSGCDSLDPLIVQLQDDRGAAAKVAGSWTGNATVSAQSLAFTLTVQDTTVTGTGSYSAETHGGNLDVQGSATRSGVRLDLFLDDLSTAHFVGTQPSSTTLTGTLSYQPVNGTASSQAITFTKQ